MCHLGTRYCDTNAHDCDTYDAAARDALLGELCAALARNFAASARE